MKWLLIMLAFWFTSCQSTEDAIVGTNQRIDAVEYQINFEWYDRMINFCLLQGEICTLKKRKNCYAKKVRCVRAVNNRWLKIKKNRGWQ
jgi:hypothetical protein